MELEPLLEILEHALLAPGRLEELKEVCSYHFQDERLCLGLFQDESEQAGLAFLSSQTPVPRRISKTCLGVIGEEADSDENACSECR